MFIPPIIAKKIFELQSFSAPMMACHIMHLLRIETPGDTEADETAQSTFSIDKEYHSLITWLHYFDKVKEVNLDPVLEGSDLADASKDLQNRVLGPTSPPPGSATYCSPVGPATSYLANHMTNQSALQSEQNEFLKLIATNMERSGSNRRGFDRLVPKSCKNMIQMKIGTLPISIPLTKFKVRLPAFASFKTTRIAILVRKKSLVAGLKVWSLRIKQTKYVSPNTVHIRFYANPHPHRKCNS